MTALLLANSAADAMTGVTTPPIDVNDGVTRYDYYQTLPWIEPTPAGGFNPFRADAQVFRPAEFPIAFAMRGMSSAASTWAENLDGSHGEIARQNGSPVGAHEPFGGAYRSVVRPIPSAWDSGYWTQ